MRLACPASRIRRATLAAVARGIVHGVIDRAQLERLGKAEEVAQEHGILARDQALADRPVRRGEPGIRIAGRFEFQKFAHQGAARITIDAGAEIENQPGVAGEILFAGQGQQFLEQAALAHPGLAANIDCTAAPGVATRLQQRPELLDLGAPSHERLPLRARAKGREPPGAHRRRQPVNGEQSRIDPVEPVDERAPDRVGNQDLSRPRGIGEAGGQGSPTRR